MVLAEIVYRPFQSVDGFGFEDDTAPVIFGKGKISGDLQISGAERQMVTVTGCVMQMHMPQI